MLLIFYSFILVHPNKITWFHSINWFFRSTLLLYIIINFIHLWFICSIPLHSFIIYCSISFNYFMSFQIKCTNKTKNNQPFKLFMLLISIFSFKFFRRKSKEWLLRLWKYLLIWSFFSPHLIIILISKINQGMFYWEQI